MSTRRLVIPLILMTLALSACFPFNIFNPEPDSAAIYTAAAGTIIAQSTLAAGETAVYQLTQIAQGTSAPTATPPATSAAPTAEVPSPTAVIPSPLPVIPTATNVPVVIPTYLPSPTWVPPTPTRTPVPIPCDWAQFVQDVTVPDGTTFLPGTAFTKVWRIRNIGSCAWNTSYALVFSSGDRMQGARSTPLPGMVYPGQSVDLVVNLVAPSAPGHYRGYWMLRNSAGRDFGIGASADKPFWVDIQVAASSNDYALDFASNMCSAAWSNGFRSLPCPGNAQSAQGSVILLNQPVLEDGRHENEPTLWTRPEPKAGGVITGAYPKYRVQPGDRFMAEVGCLKDYPGCGLVFSLSYQVDGGMIQTLGSWAEVYDGRVTRIDIDLSALAGQAVQFILTVANTGDPAQGQGFWLAPSVRRSSNPAWESIPAVQAARQTVAQQTGTLPGQWTITAVTAVDWRDTCLGIHLPDQFCAAAIIPGYRIVLVSSFLRVEAHTNQDGSLVLWFEI